jgi:hypothetical protein
MLANHTCRLAVNRWHDLTNPATDSGPAVADWLGLLVPAEQNLLDKVQDIDPPADQAGSLKSLFAQLQQTVNQLKPVKRVFVNGTESDGDWQKLQAVLDTQRSIFGQLKSKHGLYDCSTDV